MNILDVKSICFRYNRGPYVLKNISFSVKEGEIIVLLGPSGYGKSTLAQLISGFLKPTEGEILFEGKPLPKSGFCPIQLIYQHPEQAVNPRWKMKDILYEPGIPEEDVLKEIGIQEKWYDRWPNELSGGERQRVAICRALINDPSIIFADEPTGNLDSKSGKVVAEEFRKINEELGKTLLMVTHDPQMASWCKRVIFLKDGYVMNDVRKEGTEEEFYRTIIGEMEKF